MKLAAILHHESQEDLKQNPKISRIWDPVISIVIIWYRGLSPGCTDLSGGGGGGGGGKSIGSQSKSAVTPASGSRLAQIESVIFTIKLTTHV